MSGLKRITSSKKDGSEGESEESYSTILFDTSLTCIALCTVVQYSACSQCSSHSTDHMRKHIDTTHASAWLKVACKKARALTYRQDLTKSGDQGPLRKRSDFNQALSRLNRLHREAGERPLRPMPYCKYQERQPSSNSSSTWWQWSGSWWSS